MEAIAPVAAGPEARLRWNAVRDAVGLEASVVIEESAKVIGFWTRDAVGGQGLVILGESPKVLTDVSRDDLVARGPAP